MRAECLPFTRIPHTSKLFLDFISNSSGARQFYPRSPHLREWVAEEAKLIQYPGERRAAVADILERQNRTFGLSTKTSENLAKFRNGAQVVVTGQQVGVFGGPLFAVLKALTAVELAAQAEAAGVPVVAIFSAHEPVNTPERNGPFRPEDIFVANRNGTKNPARKKNFYYLRDVPVAPVFDAIRERLARRAVARSHG